MKSMMLAVVWLAAWLQGLGGANSKITNVFNQPSGPVAVAGRHESLFAFAFFVPFILLAEVLLVIVIFKFRDRGDGRKAATFHENPFLESVWTIIPACVVIFIGLQSFKTLRFQEFGGVNPALNVTVVGHQFFWEYKYPQYGIDISNATLVVPAHEVVNLDLTSVDVIHGFFVPALGIQEDALPGRLTNLWFNAEPGYYKGQCTQLCGVNHAQMFIEVQALPPAQFAQWLEAQQQKKPAPAPVAAPAPAATPKAALPTATKSAESTR